MLYLEIGSYFITQAGLKVVAILTQISQMLALQVGATELGWLFLLFFFPVWFVGTGCQYAAQVDVKLAILMPQTPGSHNNAWLI